MAKVKVKLFGVFRVDTHTAEIEVDAEKINDIFGELKNKLGNIQTDSGLKFKDAVIYLNGESCKKKQAKLSNGDEIWLLSPASGG